MPEPEQDRPAMSHADLARVLALAVVTLERSSQASRQSILAERARLYGMLCTLLPEPRRSVALRDARDVCVAQPMSAPVYGITPERRPRR